MNICVFCSALDVDRIYVDAAKEFGTAIGKSGSNLVWGGSNTGLMKVVADAVQLAGGKLYGVSVEYVKDARRKNADEMIIANNLGERKRILQEKSDAFVVFPGGTGTVDEAMEMIELKKHGYHTKPIIFLSLDGYYDPLKTQFEQMYEKGFMKKPLGEFISFVSTVQDVSAFLIGKRVENMYV